MGCDTLGTVTRGTYKTLECLYTKQVNHRHLMTTLTLQVTEVLFDFDDDDFTQEEQQLVVDNTVGNVFEVVVLNPNDDDEIADVLVEEVTDFAEWTVVSLNYRHVLK